MSVQLSIHWEAGLLLIVPNLGFIMIVAGEYISMIPWWALYQFWRLTYSVIKADSKAANLSPIKCYERQVCTCWAGTQRMPWLGPLGLGESRESLRSHDVTEQIWGMQSRAKRQYLHSKFQTSNAASQIVPESRWCCPCCKLSPTVTTVLDLWGFLANLGAEISC